MNEQRFRYLFNRHFQKLATEDEKAELYQYAAGDEYNELLKSLIEETWNEEIPVSEQSEEKANEIFIKILEHKEFDTKVIPIKRRNWARVAAAAVIFILLGLGIAKMTGLFDKKQTEIATLQPQEKRFKNDVAAPGKPKATITLANGNTIELNSLNAGTIAQQGNVNVSKTADGKIIYNGSSKEVAFNTLNNPKGSTVIDITLADGSQVWLNAGSSVTYPVAFVGNERKVQMTGEAYFEITHNASKPFKVSVAGNKEEVEVLGTHFNINAFDDEAEIKTTLLQGKVRVSSTSNTKPQTTNLTPGQQSVFNPSTNNPLTITTPNLEQVMAWKNGFFDCNGLNAESIMKQVARWYDVQVTFKGTIPQDKFVGRIPRTVSLVNVLKVLELNGIHFTIEGNKITVL